MVDTEDYQYQSDNNHQDDFEEAYISSNDMNYNDNDDDKYSDDDEKPKQQNKDRKTKNNNTKQASSIATPYTSNTISHNNDITHTQTSMSYQFTTPSTQRKTLGIRLKSCETTKHKPFTVQSMTPIHNTRRSKDHMNNNNISLSAKLKQRSQSVRAEWESLSRGELNAYAMQNNKQLNLRREPLQPDLSIQGAENVSDSFIVKFQRCRIDGKMKDTALALLRNRPIGKRLGVRNRIVNGLINNNIIEQQIDDTLQSTAPGLPDSMILPVDDSYEALVIWQPTVEQKEQDPSYCDIIVDEFLGRKLRPHQRDGVQFMSECVLGLRSFNGNGCILADDMGLGKTCQSVTLMYTLLRHGQHIDTPTAKRVIVVCPTSLVSNWKNEVHKWVGDMICVIALTESDKKSVDKGIDDFLRPYPGQRKAHVLVLSYDTYRRRKTKFNKPDTCDLLICDEAHRLKNSDTAIYKALNGLQCKRRVLLSGTPLQNDLSEFYAMVNFVNPDVLGDSSSFSRYYEQPILSGREPDAFQEERMLGATRSVELSAIVNQFVLRRTNVLLSQHLPPKVMQVVCCRPTPLQVTLYKYFAGSKAVKQAVLSENGNSTGVLPLIDKFKKLCNHPKIVYDNDIKNDPQLHSMFPADFHTTSSHPQWSGKMLVLDQLLQNVKKYSNDRVVIVSNFTNTLDVIGDICKLRNWGYLRLDGSTAVKKRQALVDQLGDKHSNVFVFLLSSKAGGCGLNMIGANRLILFDPDWNPAVDKQAAARVWRDGQTKRCFIYRFVTTGSIEEKVYQRQITKEGLTGAIGGESIDSNVSIAELRDLFDLQDESIVPLSDTHDTLECSCCNDIVNNVKKRERKFRIRKQRGKKNDNNTNNKQDNKQHINSGSDNEAQLDNENNESGNDSSSSDSDNDNDNDNDNEPSSTPSSSEKQVQPPTTTEATNQTSGSDSTVTSSDVLTNELTAKKSSRTAMMGQRGEPAEDELINWAHHVTVQSIPDPIFRTTYKQLLVHNPDNWSLKYIAKSYVSFIFSCEVKGKSLSVEDDMFAAKFSSMCNLQPVVKKKAKAETIEMSAEQAAAKHQEWINKKLKKQQQQNNDDEYVDNAEQSPQQLQDKKSKYKTNNKMKQNNNDIDMNDSTNNVNDVNEDSNKENIIHNNNIDLQPALQKVSKKSTKSSASNDTTDDKTISRKKAKTEHTTDKTSRPQLRVSNKQLSNMGIDLVTWNSMDHDTKKMTLAMFAEDIQDINNQSKQTTKNNNKKTTQTSIKSFEQQPIDITDNSDNSSVIVF